MELGNFERLDKVISKQDLNDLLVTAFEGGINYWVEKVELDGEWPKESKKYLSDMLTEGFNLKIYEAEGEILTLTLDDFKKGVQIYEQIHEQDLESLMDDHDADTADFIVQYALFGEIVYG